MFVVMMLVINYYMAHNISIPRTIELQYRTNLGVDGTKRLFNYTKQYYYHSFALGLCLGYALANKYDVKEITVMQGIIH